MRALHFCKNPEADEEAPSRIYKVEKVLDFFNKRMQDVYQPSKNLLIDGTLAGPSSISTTHKKQTT